MGKGRSKAPDFVERQAAAATARKAMLEKFLAKAADPDAAKRLEARAAEAAERDAARRAREKAKAEQKAKEAEAAAAAEREAAAAAERAAAEAARQQSEKEAEQKAARDARYAARKAKGKAGGKRPNGNRPPRDPRPGSASTRARPPAQRRNISPRGESCRESACRGGYLK